MCLVLNADEVMSEMKGWGVVGVELASSVYGTGLFLFLVVWRQGGWGG